MSNFREYNTDILIIGGGGAAAMAALAANRQGAHVIAVSKESSLVGGATIQSGGGISIINDPKDNTETFYQDILRGGGYLNDPEVVKVFTGRTRQVFETLETYGFLMDRTSSSLRKVINVEGHSYPRSYTDRRENLGWCHGLGAALAKSDVKMFRETMIDKIIIDQGQAVGALGFSLVNGEYMVFSAKAVLLATGGLGQLFKMTTNARTTTGDGFAMAWDAGAKLINMEMIQCIPFSFAYPKTKEGVNLGMCSVYGPNVKLFNNLGERYMEKYDQKRKEYSTRDVVARANFTEILEGRGTERDAIIVDPTDNDRSLLSYYQSAHPHQYIRVRDAFGEDAANWRKPFEATPAVHFSMGGVMINENCETSVLGLFAAGEVSGGLHGANRLAGNGLAEALGFGDLAGNVMARWIRGRRHVPINTSKINADIGRLEKTFSSEHKDGIRPFQIKQKIKKIMWTCCGPIRSKDSMEKAMTDLENIRNNDLPKIVSGSPQIRYGKERMEAAEVGLMIKTAILIVNSALLRKESRGSHYRKDFPAKNDKEWLKIIEISKSVDEDLTINLKSHEVTR